METRGRVFWDREREGERETFERQSEEEKERLLRERGGEGEMREGESDCGLQMLATGSPWGCHGEQTGRNGWFEKLPPFFTVSHSL